MSRKINIKSHYVFTRVQIGHETHERVELLELFVAVLSQLVGVILGLQAANIAN